MSKKRWIVVIMLLILNVIGLGIIIKSSIIIIKASKINKQGEIRCLIGCPEKAVVIKCKNIHEGGRSCTTIEGREFDADVLKLWCNVDYNTEKRRSLDF